jgi:hypothetical protein
MTVSPGMTPDAYDQGVGVPDPVQEAQRAAWAGVAE